MELSQVLVSSYNMLLCSKSINIIQMWLIAVMGSVFLDIRVIYLSENNTIEILFKISKSHFSHTRYTFHD